MSGAIAAVAAHHEGTATAFAFSFSAVSWIVTHASRQLSRNDRGFVVLRCVYGVYRTCVYWVYRMRVYLQVQRSDAWCTGRVQVYCCTQHDVVCHCAPCSILCASLSVEDIRDMVCDFVVSDMLLKGCLYTAPGPDSANPSTQCAHASLASVPLPQGLVCLRSCWYQHGAWGSEEMQPAVRECRLAGRLCRHLLCWGRLHHCLRR